MAIKKNLSLRLKWEVQITLFPNLERDHPLPVILQMADDYDVYLSYGVFMIYTERKGNTYLLYYAFDYQENLRQSVKAHFSFTKNNKVYIPAIKDFYRSPIRSEFDEEKQLWRFL